MPEQYEVTVRGSGQCGGPVRIFKTVVCDHNMAIKYRGGNRYEVLAGFVRAHYPGVTFNPRDLSATVKPIKEKKPERIPSISIDKNSVAARIKTRIIFFLTGIFIIASLLGWILLIVLGFSLQSWALAIPVSIGAIAYIITWKLLLESGYPLIKAIFRVEWNYFVYIFKWSAIAGFGFMAISYIIAVWAGWAEMISFGSLK